MYCQFDFYMIVLQSLLTIDYFMSKKMSNKDNKNLNQISKTKRRLDGQSQILRHRVQQSLREEAAEMTDGGQDSKGPA
jgi:hypothetical protein